MAATVSITCRNLTDVFVLMRNNSLQNRHVYSQQIIDDKVALVSSGDFESGRNSFFKNANALPVWVEGIEDVQYEMSRIRQKLQELTSLIEKHLTRPSLDDAVQEEKEIEIITQDITRMFLHCKKLIYQIKDRSGESYEQDNQINKNVLSSLVSSLQDLSSSFHCAQSNHLKKLRCREEKSQQFFGPHYFMDNGSHSNVDILEDDGFNQTFLKSSSEQKQFSIGNNSLLIEQREREIKQIVRSLAELNDIFQDLATMVADQGTVLDRIDFNLEKVQNEVHCGLQQLQKAKRYNQKNQKMICILLLAITTSILIILLVTFKT